MGIYKWGKRRAVISKLMKIASTRQAKDQAEDMQLIMTMSCVFCP